MQKRRFINVITLLALPFLLSGCLWPYKTDFDCKTPEGQHCQSLSSIDKQLREGAFDNKPDESLCGKRRCPCKPPKKR